MSGWGHLTTHTVKLGDSLSLSYTCLCVYVCVRAKFKLFSVCKTYKLNKLNEPNIYIKKLQNLLVCLVAKIDVYLSLVDVQALGFKRGFKNADFKGRPSQLEMLVLKKILLSISQLSPVLF